MSLKSKNVRGSVAVAIAEIAFGLIPRIASPAGSIKSLLAYLPRRCPRPSLPCRTASTRSRTHAVHEEHRGMVPSVLARRMPAMSDFTPVAVSLWVASTALILWAVSARSASARITLRRRALAPGCIPGDLHVKSVPLAHVDPAMREHPEPRRPAPYRPPTACWRSLPPSPPVPVDGRMMTSPSAIPSTFLTPAPPPV